MQAVKQSRQLPVAWVTNIAEVAVFAPPRKLEATELETTRSKAEQARPGG